MSTRPRFEKEAKGNSEMVYCGGHKKKSNKYCGIHSSYSFFVFFTPAHSFVPSRAEPSRHDQLRARNRLFNHRNDSHPDPSGIELSELIRVKLPPQVDCKTDVSSDSPSSQRTSLSRNAAPQFVFNLNPSFFILEVAFVLVKKNNNSSQKIIPANHVRECYVPTECKVISVLCEGKS